MVLLTPPAGWSAAGEAVSASAEPAPAPSTPAANAPAHAAESSAADFAAVNDIGLSLSGTQAPVAPSGAPAEPSDRGSRADPSDAADPTMAGAGDQGAASEAGSPFVVAPAEATSRWVATAIGVGGMAVVLGIGLAVFVFRDNDENPQPIAQSPPTAAPLQLAAAESPTVQPPEQPQPPAEVVALKPPAEASEEEDSPPEAEAPSLPPPVGNPLDPGPGEAELPAVDPLLAGPPAPEEQSPPEPAVEPDPEVEPEPPRPVFDPLDLDPAGLDLILTRGKRKAEPKPAPQQSKPAPVSDLAARLANKTQPGGVLDNRLGELANQARATVRRGPTGPAMEPPGEPLATVIPSIQLAEIPLDRAYRLLGDLAGVPLTLEPDALRYAAIGADRKVSLSGTGLTIGELAEQIGKPNKLEITESEGRWIVSRVGAGRTRQASFSVDDLLPVGASDASWMVGLLESLLADSSAAIKAEGKKLVVDGPLSDHMEVALVCERLRKARGLKPRSRYPQALLRTTPALEDLKKTLDRPTTFTFVDFTPLPEVFDHWRRATGLTILVDWATLSDKNLTPQTSIACSVNSRPWRQALDAVLEPLGLGWRAVDGRTLQITAARSPADSPAAEQARPSQATVEFYPLPATADGELLAQSLNDLAEPGGDISSAYFDKASQTLVARLSNAGHRELLRRLAEED